MEKIFLILKSIFSLLSADDYLIIKIYILILIKIISKTSTKHVCHISGRKISVANLGAYHWGHSFAKQDIDDRILHCLSIKKLKIGEPG